MQQYSECEACDGEGSISYQWAKEACTKTGGTRVFLNDGTWYYTTEEGREIYFKTVGGPCSECGGKDNPTYKNWPKQR